MILGYSLIVVLAVLLVAYFSGLRSLHDVRLLISIFQWAYFYDFMMKREEEKQKWCL